MTDEGFLTPRNGFAPAQLRRTKSERSEDEIAPSHHRHSRDGDERSERDFYESLYMLTRAKFDGTSRKVPSSTTTPTSSSFSPD